jgi:hypothetical protein
MCEQDKRRAKKRYLQREVVSSRDFLLVLHNEVVSNHILFSQFDDEFQLFEGATSPLANVLPMLQKKETHKFKI